MYLFKITNLIEKFQLNVAIASIYETIRCLEENLERITPNTVDIEIHPDTWPVPPVFPWLAQLGEIESDEMKRVFNMGIGLVLVVSPFYAKRINQIVEAAGFDCYEIGRVVDGTGRVMEKKS